MLECYSKFYNAPIKAQGDVISFAERGGRPYWNNLH